MSKHEENQTALEMAQAAYVPHVLTDIVMGLQVADLKHLNGLPGVGKSIHEAVGYLVNYAVAGKYNKATVYRGGNDVMCLYERDDGGKFFICAHWGEYARKWGFHS